jgi:phenylalanyl-tRNA synthetase beta chain
VEIVLRPAAAVKPAPTVVPPPAYPAVERDVALLVPDDLPAARVEATIRGAAGQLLEQVFPFDVFEGRGIPEGKRSIAYRLRYRAPDRTLTDREVDESFARTLQRLKEELGVEPRG